MTWFCEFVLDMLRQVCGSGLEIAEVQGGGHSAATLRLCARHRALRNLLVQHGKCQQCMVKEGLTWLVYWRDEVQKMQVQEANVAIDYRNAARCKSWIAGSAGEIRLCMDTSPAWWQSARSAG